MSSDFQQTLEPTPEPTDTTVAPSDISVAVLYPGNRVEKVMTPLAASDLTVAVDPEDAYEYDIVLADNADRSLGREVLKKPTHDAALIYRMRGDVFRELDLWPMHPVKRWAARNVVLRNVDGVIAVTDRLADKFHDRTGLSPVGSAGLAKDPKAWPTVDHTDEELRICTLTNANYWRKVEPLTEWAPVVDEILADVGGRWRICGDGKHAQKLEIRLRGYDNVEFGGYVDAEEELSRSNLMIHASRLDGQPNSILEGLAAGLPVITNPWPEFVDYGWPLEVVSDARQLRHRLERYTDPGARQERGQAGIETIKMDHSPETIGHQYERYFARVVGE